MSSSLDILKDPRFKNPICQRCIKDQLAKYEGFVSEKGHSFTKFSVPCQGIPVDYLGKWKDVLSPQEQKEAEELLDPVLWAKRYLRSSMKLKPWEAYWYQEQFLRCTSRRKVTRCGRRLGKCLEEGTEVMTPTGPVEIQNLKPGDIVYAYNVDTDSVSPVPVKQLYDRGIQDVVDLKRDGKVVVSCTPKHRFYFKHALQFAVDLAGEFDLGSPRAAQCFDISIDTPDNLYLLANGLVTHNSDALAVDILHSCYTKEHTRVLVIAPRKAHVEEIIGRIKDFVYNSPELQNSIARSVASPYYEITFGNKSRIRGFSSGSSSGSEGLGIRGQDADRIYIDEADYLISRDLSAIMAITLTTPEVYVWASSTPSGKRQHFYNWCTKSPQYKEFHNPSTDIPHWEQIRNDVELEYSGRPDDWQHEILANWGEQAVGVFQVQFIDRASRPYEYKDQRPQAGWIYSMGIDWNSKAGTEIVITGYDGHGIFKTVDVANVPKQQWTQLKGMDAIIAVNAKWRPSFLYMDAGYGHTNVELLRKYGTDMAAKNPSDPACIFKDGIKTYDFGSKLDVYDLVTRRQIQKYAKPFLVENTVRRFEENTIQISSYDSLLIQQLENYIIDHRTSSGRPVFKALDEKIGDHRLDAFMLSLIGFKLEMSLFGRPAYSLSIAFSEGFGQNRGKADTAEKTSDTTIRRQKDLSGATRIPTNRYPEPALIKNHSLPAQPNNSNTERICSKTAWETDTEEEFKARYLLKKAKQRARFRRSKIERHNI